MNPPDGWGTYCQMKYKFWGKKSFSPHIPSEAKGLEESLHLYWCVTINNFSQPTQVLTSWLGIFIMHDSTLT